MTLPARKREQSWRPSAFEVLASSADGVGVYRLRGELDSTSAGGARRELSSAPASRVILDLSGVTRIDAVGLAVVIGALRRVHEAGGLAVLAAPRPPVARVLSCAGLHHLVPVVDSVRDALCWLGSDAGVVGGGQRH